MNPDYGLYHKRLGITKEKSIYFYDFRMYNLDILGKASYTSLVDYYHEIMYAASFDFDDIILGKILSYADRIVAEKIRNEILKDPATRRRLDFNFEILVPQIETKLGEEIVVAQEKFVPFIITKVN
ncbi:MAG: hypothetical protein LHV68_08760 [Elusimicrobia bacterium]|nr:hypothetical protein [Candidatus Liberimonas magnetica]